MKIICGTDFSRPAARAADVGAGLARALGDELVLVHGLASAGADAGSPELRKTLRKQLRARLDAEARRLSAAGTIVSTALDSGPGDEALARRSRAASVRMIVVSSLGHRSARRWKLGGVSDRTAQTAAAPTLVVRDPAPLLAWIRRERPLRIFVAFDFTAGADAALAWLKDLCATAPCEVTVGYADWPPGERARLGFAAPPPLLGNSPALQEMLERHVRHRVEATLGRGSTAISVRACWGAPDFTLLEMARESDAHVIVTGTHQYRGARRLWHGSVSRNLLQHAPVSVACVPASPALSAAVRAPHRILAATDFSEEGNRAVLHAGAMLGPGGQLKVVHVAKGRKTSDAGRLGRLRAVLPDDAMNRGITVLAEVLEGDDPASAICAEAERFDADLICLGSHNGPTLARSITRAILARSKRPLVVIHARGP